MYNQTVTVTVAGPTGSGKTAILQKIATMLIADGVSNVLVDWGMDGCPHRTPEQCNKVIDSMNKRGTAVLIKEVHTSRSPRPKPDVSDWNSK